MSAEAARQRATQAFRRMNRVLDAHGDGPAYRQAWDEYETAVQALEDVTP